NGTVASAEAGIGKGDKVCIQAAVGSQTRDDDLAIRAVIGFPELAAEENLAVGLDRYRPDRKAAKRRIRCESIICGSVRIESGNSGRKSPACRREASTCQDFAVGLDSN